MNDYDGGAIHTNFESGYELKNLKINGTNTITVNDTTSTRPAIGFGTKVNLKITGVGTLNVNIKTSKSINTVGVYSGAYEEEKHTNLGNAGSNNIEIIV